MFWESVCSQGSHKRNLNSEFHLLESAEINYSTCAPWTYMSMILAFKKIKGRSFCFTVHLSRLKKKPEMSNINQHKINNKKKRTKVFCD